MVIIVLLGYLNFILCCFIYVDKGLIRWLSVSLWFMCAVLLYLFAWYVYTVEVKLLGLFDIYDAGCIVGRR